MRKENPTMDFDSRKWPWGHWKLDFAEIRHIGSGYKYLLFVDTFSGWVKIYPTRTETAPTVTKKLLQEIIPRFELPLALVSSNDPDVAAKVSQNMTKVLNISWKLYCAYRPQSSGHWKNE